jgi:hypothetical protein
MMTAARFDTIARRLFGDRYAVPLAAALGITPSAISRYADPDGNPIPGPVAAALFAWEEDHIETGRYPPVAPGSLVRFDPGALRSRRGRKPRHLALLQSKSPSDSLKG